jgi:hypothetical protein
VARAIRLIPRLCRGALLFAVRLTVGFGLSVVTSRIGRTPPLIGGALPFRVSSETRRTVGFHTRLAPVVPLSLLTPPPTEAIQRQKRVAGTADASFRRE